MRPSGTDPDYSRKVEWFDYGWAAALNAPLAKEKRGIWGWPHWLRYPFLVVLYFPFWRTVNAVQRGWLAAFGHINLVTDDELCAITAPLKCHPEDWHHPCMCAECRSYE